MGLYLLLGLLWRSIRSLGILGVAIRVRRPGRGIPGALRIRAGRLDDGVLGVWVARGIGTGLRLGGSSGAGSTCKAIIGLGLAETAAAPCWDDDAREACCATRAADPSARVG